MVITNFRGHKFAIRTQLHQLAQGHRFNHYNHYRPASASLLLTLPVLAHAPPLQPLPPRLCIPRLCVPSLALPVLARPTHELPLQLATTHHRFPFCLSLAHRPLPRSVSHTLRSFLSNSLASRLSTGFPFCLSLAHRPLLRSAPHTLRSCTGRSRRCAALAPRAVGLSRHVGDREPRLPGAEVELPPAEQH